MEAAVEETGAPLTRAPARRGGVARSQSRATTVRLCEKLSRAGGLLVLSTGAIVMLGWLFDVAFLKRLHPSLASMKANTALCFMMTSAALLALDLHRRRNVPRHRWAARALSGATIGVAGLSLLEYATGRLGIDELLFVDHGGGATPGRMSIATATCFVLLGFALILDSARGRFRYASPLALTTGLAALLALLGYAYGVNGLYAVSAFASVALHTAVAFAILSIAILFARPEVGLMRPVTSDGPGGVLARTMLPMAIVFPAVIGWLRLEGQRAGLYGTEFGLALFAVANIVCFSALIGWTAGALYRADLARRGAEDDLRERETELATTLDSIGDGVIATDASGRITRMNPIAEGLTGWRLADAAGRHLQEVFRITNEDTQEPVENPVTRVLRDGIVVGLANHTSLTSRRGTSLPIADSGAPIRDVDGSIRGVVMVFRDMTQERSAAKALESSHARFGALYDSGVIGILVGSETGGISDANGAFLRIVGYSREDLETKKLGWSDLTPDDWSDQTTVALGELATRGFTNAWEKELLCKDGSRVQVLVGMAAVDERDNICFVADLTALRRAEDARARLEVEAARQTVGRARAEEALRQTEEQLRQAQKMEAVGRLAGGVAHDFNNILSVILSLSDVMLSELDPSQPMREDIEEIRKAGARAADLTRQLLMFSRQQVLEPKVLDMNELIANMEKMIRRLVGEDVELTVARGPSTGKVRVDAGSMEQVVMNLAVNARDAMPTGGKLMIETRCVVLDEAYARDHLGTRPGPHLLLAVSDSGTGMDRATQARIFEPFFTTKERGKGTGLGLSTVFGIVQQSGGSIWVYSEPGAGTTFKVYLPLVEATLDEMPKALPPAMLRGSETVLLVEDEDQVRAVAKTILKRQGYRILEARNAGEALLLCEKHAGKIDLLLSDVVMPKMSGPELARRLGAGHPQMKILCMSGYTDDAVAMHGGLGPGIAFLQKPITPDSLTRKVREVLDSKPKGERN